MHNFIRLIKLALVVVFALSSVLCIGYYIRGKEYKARCGVSITAEIVRYNKRGSSYYPVLSYDDMIFECTDNSNEFDATSDRYAIGDKVELYYNANNKAEFYITEPYRTYYSYFLLMAVGSLLGIVLFFVFAK